MTAVAPSRKPATIVRKTGHPSPLEQIGGQRRSQTGATYGAMAHRLPPGWRGANLTPRAEPALAKAPSAEPVLFASGGDAEQDMTALLATMHRLAEQGAELPRCHGLGELAGGKPHRTLASVVHNRMRGLVGAGLIAWCYGTTKPWQGEMVVRLNETGKVLRTRLSPRSWVVPE
jgi:hypothetical protein